MADHRPNVYYEAEGAEGNGGTGGRWVYRASALGACLGSLVRERMGFSPEPPPEWLLQRFAEGSEWEGKLLRMVENVGGVKMLDDLEAYGVVGEDGQVEVEIEVGDNAIVRCHPDGICEGKGGRRVVEVKFLGEDLFRKLQNGGLDEFPFYSWQLSVEMIATGLPALYGMGLKETMDSGEVVGVKEFVVKEFDTPPFTLKQIRGRVLKIERMAENGEIPECDWAMYPCGFWGEHDKTGVWSDIGKKGSGEFGEGVKILEEGEERYEELKAAGEEFLLAKAVVDHWEPELKKAREKLRVLMSEEKKGDRIGVDRFEFKKMERVGSVDWKKVAKEVGGVDVDKGGFDEYRGKGSVWVEVRDLEEEKGEKGKKGEKEEGE